MTNLCDTASRKTEILARIFQHKAQTLKGLLMNAYFWSQFGTILYFG